MAPSAPASPLDLARHVPDEPRWIDLRGLLLSARCDVWTDDRPERGFVAASWDYPFASLYGRPRPALIAAAVSAARALHDERSRGEEWQLLAPPEARELMQQTLPGWHRRGIVIHRLTARLETPDIAPGFELRLCPDGHQGTGLALDHVPTPSRRELSLEWVARRPLVVAIADARPVSFCYAAFVTERLWDVSVETLEPFRRRGLATACFLRLAAHMAELGKEPAWGSMLDNPASLGLAARLGFVEDGRLDGWEPVPGDRPGPAPDDHVNRGRRTP